MYKNSRSTVLLPLVVAAAVALGIFLGQFLGRSSAESDIKGILRSLALPQNKVSQTLSLIETQYVDSVAIDSLVERALPVIVSELDPHSVYIPASEMAEINEPLDGEFDGIGVVFNMATDTVIVLNVIPSGPSDKAGVVAGDRIVRINDSLVAGQQIAQREIMRRLRGKRGSEVRLGLERRGIDELVEVTVVRDKIPIRSLTAALMLTGDIAFVKLDQFARTSHTELLEALSTLRTQGMCKLILDLRGNSGGFLDQAIAIANEFLPADKLIVYTEDRNHQRIEQYSDGTGSAADLDLAVLVDEGSASSSEILAGALQDNDRGTIIGRRSFGKGLVQQQIPYADGSALRLTVARYYTPTGRSIQKPYTSGDAESYDADVRENQSLGYLCYLGPLLIIPLLVRPKSRFLRYHCNQGLLLLIAAVLVSIFDGLPGIGWLIGIAGSIAALIWLVQGMLNVNRGVRRPLPLIGDITILK